MGKPAGIFQDGAGFLSDAIPQMQATLQSRAILEDSRQLLRTYTIVSVDHGGTLVDIIPASQIFTELIIYIHYVSAFRGTFPFFGV